MFFIRTAFWLSLVIICLPSGNADDENSTGNEIGAVDALGAAQTTYSDLAKFCERNAETCNTGGMAISSFGQKARYGAQVVFEYLDNKFGDEKPSSSASENS